MILKGRNDDDTWSDTVGPIARKHEPATTTFVPSILYNSKFKSADSRSSPMSFAKENIVRPNQSIEDTN